MEIIIHAGCSDLSNNTNPQSNIKKITKLVKDEVPECKLTFSKIEKTSQKLISETNKHIKNYCEQNNCGFIDYSNIDESLLGQKKLHMSKKDASMVTKNILYESYTSLFFQCKCNRYYCWHTVVRYFCAYVSTFTLAMSIIKYINYISYVASATALRANCLKDATPTPRAFSSPKQSEWYI